jgi:hypothetical protein
MIKNSKAVKIISYLMENPSAKVAEVAAKNNVSKSYAHKIMKSFDAPFRKPEAKETQVGGSHYRDMLVQPWDALEAWMTIDEIRGYHKGVAISYLAREHRKGGDEDIAKAIHHLTALMDLLRG